MRGALIKKLDAYEVTRYGSCAVKEITAQGVRVTKPDGSEELLECDTVITAFGIRPDKKFVEELKEIVPETYVVGDAYKTGLIGDATNSAYYACMSIDA